MKQRGKTSGLEIGTKRLVKISTARRKEKEEMLHEPAAEKP